MRAATIVVAAVLLAGCRRGEATRPTHASEATSDRFHDVLAPYGSWIDTREHGRVWVPAQALVGPDFFPYMSDGTWVYTDRGWLFESLYSWGWAPFHYGRWAFAERIGWMWIPGEAWAPAWVDWRWGGGYVAWAPLPPSRPSGRAAKVPRSHWLVVEAGWLPSPRLATQVLPRGQAEAVWIGTAPERSISGVVERRWEMGPPPHEIESMTGERLRPLQLVAPPPGAIVRSQVEGTAVRHEPPAPRSRPLFTAHPSTLPMHAMHPHALFTPVDEQRTQAK